MTGRSGSYKGNKGLEYYKAYPRDFFEGTVGMRGQLKGFYRMVLDLIYMHDGLLMKDYNHVSGLTGYGKTQCKRMLQELLDMEKIHIWTENDEFFTQKRAVSELKTSRKFQENQSKKAIKRHENNNLAKTTALPNNMPEVCHHKTTRPQDSLLRDPDNFPVPKVEKNKPIRFEEFWDEYPHRGGSKKGKKLSKAKYEKAVKSGVSEDIIISKAKELHRDKMVVDGFAKDPATWLHNEGWNDEIETHSKIKTPTREQMETEEYKANRRRYLERTAESMHKSGGGWVIGSSFVSDRDIAEMKKLGITPKNK